MNTLPKAAKHTNWDVIAMSFILLMLCMVLGGAFLALTREAGQSDFTSILESSYIQRILKFTIYQALLSTVLSILVGLPLARFFFYHRFPGRQFILGLFGLCLVMPTIVVILGLVQVHGNSGILISSIKAFGYKPDSYLYGLTGILLAHIFYNGPLVVRTLLSRLEAIPAEQWRVAIQLDFTSWQRFKLIELPAIRSALPGLAALILMLCFTSFAIILTLGGGPKATTLEVAIYQALHFDFDLARAVALSALQILICGGTAFVLFKFSANTNSEISNDTRSHCPVILQKTKFYKTLSLDWIMLACLIIFVFPPLLSVIYQAFANFELAYLLKPALGRAILTSLLIAFLAGSFSVIVAISLCAGLRHIENKTLSSLIETSGSLILVFPPFALASGLFILFHQYATVDEIGPILVVLINGLMALPFTLRVLVPAFRQRQEETNRLCQNLGIFGWDRLKQVDYPLLRGPISLALAYAVTLSIGDFGIIALFGSENFTTLPLYIYRAMGAYHMGEAAVSAMILMLLCYALFSKFDRSVIKTTSEN